MYKFSKAKPVGRQGQKVPDPLLGMAELPTSTSVSSRKEVFFDLHKNRRND
jgi:hypothetical protein